MRVGSGVQVGVGDGVRVGVRVAVAVGQTSGVKVGVKVGRCVAVGVAQACLSESLHYAQGRQQFSQPIYNFQAVQFKLADMAVAIELARNQYLKAAWLLDKKRNYSFEASVAKLYASEMAEKVASDAFQIHGGYGFMAEYPVSRYYKGVKILQIVEGTSEIQRLVIGRIIARGAGRW